MTEARGDKLVITGARAENYNIFGRESAAATQLLIVDDILERENESDRGARWRLARVLHREMKYGNLS